MTSPHPSSRKHTNGEIPDPFTSLRFRWPWRPYQARVLAALEDHLEDDRIHIVAAPGSGKTVLGLEIIRRLGRPAVVLSPTRTVRDQWLARLGDFQVADERDGPGWASTTLDHPGPLTSITYQALHTRHKAAEQADDDEEADEASDAAPSNQEIDDVAGIFRASGVGVLVLDEAHHLRKAWWRALARIIERVDGLTVVSLTATPPYDAVGAEWARYEELCGPIDEEISVPELIRSGTLCPHQDYVWAVRPTAREAAALHDYEAAVAASTAEMFDDGLLLAAVAQHPWTAAPEAESVLEDPELAASLLVFLKAKGHPLPQPLLSLLDADGEDLPPLDRRWWQVLIRHYLWGNTWAPSEEREAHSKALARALRTQGLLWRRELRLQASRPVTTLLTMSTAKLDACLSIYEHERAFRGDRLRQVVLCDYIRDTSPDRLGALPIFTRLATAATPEAPQRFALLTGRLAAVHASHVPRLRRWAAAEGGSLRHEPMAALPGFHQVSVHGGGPRMVALITRLLDAGKLHVLVGTRALLGEGWDAPAVNSLVLASYVGSFVTTNQMRGRAIRRDPNHPDKAASVWHLVTIDPRTDTGTADWSGLERRFRAFVGLTAGAPTIESGLDRLRLPSPRSEDAVSRINQIAAARLQQSHALGERWHAAIEVGTHGHVVPSVRIRRPPARPRHFFWATMKYLLIAGAGAAYWAFTIVVRAAVDSQALVNRPWLVLGIAASLALLFATPPLFRAGRAWLRALPVDGVIRQVALAVFEALREAGEIGSELDASAVEVQEMAPGVFATALQGGTFYEQSIFADAVDEVLAPIANPRYLITRSDGSGGRRADIHAVPALLAANKEKAQGFLAHWSQRMGPAELVYTRTPEGRRALLKARSRSFSSAFEPAAQRLDRWQ